MTIQANSGDILLPDRLQWPLRGQHATPAFGIFGAAVDVAKLQSFDEGQIHSAIARCVNLAAGNLEGPA